MVFFSGQVVNWNKSSVYFGKGISEACQDNIVAFYCMRTCFFHLFILGFLCFMVLQN